MANVREILGRIKSVQNIQQITKAMKMIASARIKKVEKQLKSRKPYCEKLYEIIDEALGRVEDFSNPLTEVRRPLRTMGLLIVTGDKGLCGPYNMNVIRAAERFFREHENLSLCLYVVGSKAFRFFSRRGMEVYKSYLKWEAQDSLADEIADTIREDFERGLFDEVHCIYTKSLSMLSQKVTIERILPLVSRKEKEPGGVFTFEPEPEKALTILLPMYLKELIMRILLDARTAEMSSRLNAMSNATDNAEKLVGELQLNYYRARQETITTEILEITSSAESLKKR